jgi:hypothetical protein
VTVTRRKQPSWPAQDPKLSPSSSAWASPTVGMMPGLREEMDGGEYVKINALDI